MSPFQVVSHDPKPIEWWSDQYRANRLDLEPSFQRRSELWSRYKRAHLIDSILNGYDVPKFYVADFTLGRSSLNAKRLPYAVVDGKQRFNAVFDYLADEFPLNASSVYEAAPEIEIKGLRFSELRKLAPTLAAKISGFTPTVMSIVTDDRRRISEMFVRLNSGEAANSAEKRNAQPGPVPELVRELVLHPFFRHRVSFATKRMADHQLATKLLMMEYHGGAVDTKASNMDRFVKMAADKVGAASLDPPTDQEENELKRLSSVKDAVVENLEGLHEVFRDRDPLLKASGRIPVYYWIVRQHRQVIPNFRDFLEGFEERVLRAMRMSRDHVGRQDPKMLNYYTLSRTSNDQHSVRGRIETMEEELRKKRLI